MASKRWEKARWREVRARKFPKHPYVKQTHCSACLRQYNRERMADLRERHRGAQKALQE